MFKMEDLSIPPSNTQDLDLLELEGDGFLPVVTNDEHYDELISTYLISDPNSEETIDVAELKCNPHIPFVPISPRGPPIRKNESDKCNFVVEIDGSLTQRKKFLYSHELNRIFIEMGSNFSVNFNWDVTKVPKCSMYIRATVVFSDPDQAEKRVERCLQHAHITSNSPTMQEGVIQNVLRSAREFGDPNVYYCGNPREKDSWYSVVVLLNGPTGHAYHFVCKNSCSSGINRRPIDIIFTLEDVSGSVYGRQSVGVRVCSCPRRDKKQQEEELHAAGGKRPMSRDPKDVKEMPKKKIKLEVVSNDDNAVITLPKMDIVGPRAAITSLRVALNMMDQMRSSNRTHQQPVEDLDRCIANVKKIVDNLETKYKTYSL